MWVQSLTLTLECAYSTARAYVNCTDKFHMLRCWVVRCTYKFFFFMQSWEKMCNSCALVIQCYKFPLNHIVVKKRTFRFEKAKSTRENLHKGKTHHITLLHVASLHSSHRFAWFELLMNQERRKVSFTQGIKTCVLLSE